MASQLKRTEAPALKRPRLSIACNTCRQRKVKCDADYPQCRNCRVRDQGCVTSDPRRPGEPVVREWVEGPERTAKGPRPSIHGSTHNENTREIEPIDQDLSPAHQPFHFSLNADHETNRVKILGGSSSQCLAKSLDVYLKAAHVKPVSGMFRYGMDHTLELHIPLEVSLPELPGAVCRELWLSTFLERIHPLYPLFDVDAFRSTVQQLARVKDLKNIPREQTPWLACVYLTMSLGADEHAREMTSDGARYLHAAASLLGHVVLIPYLPAVQALLMYTIVYRGRNKEGLGWQTLGMAIRIAYTIGIHRRPNIAIPTPTPDLQCPPSENPLGRRVWAICCIFEKMFQLESGWPSVISDDIDGDQVLPPHLYPENDLFRLHLDLAEYQDQISRHIYFDKPKHRTAREILLHTARLDNSLLSWANRIPPEMRPGNDIFCPRETFHIAAWLSMLYHQSMISLHRAALVAPSAKFDAEIDEHCSENSSRFRLRGGESICVSSARSIVKLNIELSDLKADTKLVPIGVPLLACIVLAIYLVKHPRSRFRSADLQLLKTCVEHSSEQWTKCNQDSRFIQGLVAIYERVNGYIQSVNAAPETSTPVSFPNNCEKHTSTTTNGLSTPFSPVNTSAASASPATQAGLHMIASPALRAHVNAPDGRNQEPFNVLDAYSTTDGFSQQNLYGVDNSFTFEACNMEDLWEMMRYFDSVDKVSFP